MRISIFSLLQTCIRYLLKWALVTAVVAFMAALSSALFLFLLEWVTLNRMTHPQLLWGLPFAGFTVAWIYLQWGQAVEGGYHYVLAEMLSPQHRIPFRMAPFILLATVVSHAFGASVGREGTAVQMGASLADQLSGWCRLDKKDRTIVLMTGISAGFAAVFGTSMAGALFAIEVVARGSLRYYALLPCLMAAFLANSMGTLLGIQHQHYSAGSIPFYSILILGTVVVAAIAFGLCANIFSRGVQLLSQLIKNKINYPPLRPFVVGCIIALISLVWDIQPYLGLSLDGIEKSFMQPVHAENFASKFVLTVSSVASGFKGGEVTPLFYIGATLGNFLAGLMNAPFAFFAALGFVAVFAGASHTPIACSIMAMELFGVEIGFFALLACSISFLFSGRVGIYRVQALSPRHHRSDKTIV